MYKDKAKQQLANKAAKERWKAKQAGEKRSTMPAVEKLGIPVGDIPLGIPQETRGISGSIPSGVLPANFGLLDCACLHCRSNRSSGGKSIINHGPHKPYYQLAANEVNRVSLPGDVDYVGVCKK